MIVEDLQRQSSGTLKGSFTTSSAAASVKKQPKLRRSSAGTTAGKTVAGRKNSASEHVNNKALPGLAVANMRKSLSQSDFAQDHEHSLQRPAKPLQLPVQVPMQLPAGRAQLAAVGTRKWLKISADGATTILQA